MLGLVPLLCYGLLYVVIAERTRVRGRTNWRGAFVDAAVAWGVVLVALTELLSLIRSFTFGWVLSLWTVACLAVFVVSIRLSGRALPNVGWGVLAGSVGALPPFSRLLLGGVVAVLGLVGLTALLAPPNTNDALDYHMPRVAHWIQNAALTFYPTSVPWQLSHAPGAEYAIAHFQLLSNGDRWANLVQWFAVVGSVVGVTLLAKGLGADARGQVYAAAVAATIPMGVLQGATAQNDAVAAFWLVAFVHHLLFRVLQPQTTPGWWTGAGTGAALGLALLTKSTAYLFAFPFLVWFVLSGVKSARWSLWKPALAIAAVALALNLGHFARNWNLYGSPLGPGQEGYPGTTWGKYTNDAFTPTTFASNAVRNLALHTALPGIARPQTEFVGDLHRLVGADPHDLRTTWSGQRFSVYPLRANEDFAGNPLHLALGLASVGLCLASGRLRRQRGLLTYLGAIGGGFVLFALVLKWTPWVTRLHLPLFVLLAPVIALAIATIRPRGAPRLALLGLFLGVLPFVLYAERRPLVGNDFYRPWQTTGSIVAADRRAQYFVTRPQMAAPYAEAARVIQEMGCANIGLHWFGTEEYPWWVVLGEEAGGPLRLQAVNPENVTAELATTPPFDGFVPCAIVSLVHHAGVIETLTVGGTTYHRVWTSPEVGVFVPI